MDPSMEDELFSDPPDTCRLRATVGDVINLDTVSQDSVPLDDTLSVEGLTQESDASQDVDLRQSTDDVRKSSNEDFLRSELNDVRKSSDDDVRKSSDDSEEESTETAEDPEVAGKTKVGSPKPFDASLFGGSMAEMEDTSVQEFPIQVALPSSEDPESIPGEIPTRRGVSVSASEKLALKKQTSEDGFESQPIGSPGGQFQFSDVDPFPGDTTSQSITVDTVTAAEQPAVIGDFFKDHSISEDRETVIGKSFFDSFTSGGDGFSRATSVEGPVAESSPEQQGQDTLADPGPTEELTLEDDNLSAPQTTFKSGHSQTLLELARQSSQPDPQATAESTPQTQALHSPLSEVTSPHICIVEETGGELKVTINKKDSSTSSGSVANTDKPVKKSPQLTSSQPVGQRVDTPQADAPPRPRLFSSSHSKEGDDMFGAAISSSQSDQRHDAWLSSSSTQKVLSNRMSALQGTEYVDRSQLTMPGVIMEDPQGDPLKALVSRYLGDAVANKRTAPTVNQVTHDEGGLQRLLKSGCLRAALDLTGLLLTSLGQGKGQMGMPSKHTPYSLQIWLTRLSLLVKLQQYSMAEVELEAFANLDRPDLYFEYYPDLYPGRKGTMVPFSLRVLYAEIPIYLAKYQDALNRLYHVMDIVKQILFHLESGMSEYGTEVEQTEENRQASIDLWESREVRVLYSIGNCLLAMKDFNQSVSVYESLLKKDHQNASILLSGIGRIFLQLGDLKSAQKAFTKVEEMYKDCDEVKPQTAILMNKAFMHMAQNMYQDARQSIESLLELDPSDFTAINNQSVCLLYMGKLKEALSLLENLVHGDPARYLDEGLLFNLCTLYELESSRSTTKKQMLLGMVNQHRGDGFNIGCLKML